MSLSSLALDAFYTCAQIRSFTKAAERLHITQSALSQRIQNLESDLGLTLFLRERSQLKLTDEGEMLLRYCQNKEILEQETLSNIKSTILKNTGMLRIGGFSSIMRSVILHSLAPILKSKNRPKLKLLVRETHALPELLRSGEIDYMILDEKIERDHLESILLGEELYYMVKAKKYQGDLIYLDQDEADTTTHKFLRKKSNEKLERIFMDDIYGILDGVKLGLGLGVLPKHLIQQHTDLEILKEYGEKKVPFYLYFHKQPFYSQLHHFLISNITDEINNNLNSKK